jgi:ubiquinone biosynthesis protein COQ9
MGQAAQQQQDEGDSLEAIRLTLAKALANAAVFDGWTTAALDAAADQMGVDPQAARYAFRDGAMAMIGAFAAHVDAGMAQALPADTLAGLPVRERITRLVRFRLDAQAGHEEALRRALPIMALPTNAAATFKLGWRSADAMWRAAGDTATDYNHYTKRATLAAIYAATLAVFVEDASDGKADTLAFLDRRIAGIMRFEKAKAQLFHRELAGFSPVRLLGRLRYPAR